MSLSFLREGTRNPGRSPRGALPERLPGLVGSSTTGLNRPGGAPGLSAASIGVPARLPILSFPKQRSPTGVARLGASGICTSEAGCSSTRKWCPGISPGPPYLVYSRLRRGRVGGISTSPGSGNFWSPCRIGGDEMRMGTGLIKRALGGRSLSGLGRPIPAAGTLGALFDRKLAAGACGGDPGPTLCDRSNGDPAPINRSTRGGCTGSETTHRFALRKRWCASVRRPPGHPG